MSRNPHNLVKSAPGVTTALSRDVRARAWRFIFDCYEGKKKAGAYSHAGENEEKGPKRDLPATQSLPRRA
jgi:hypothetical protein